MCQLFDHLTWLFCGNHVFKGCFLELWRFYFFSASAAKILPAAEANSNQVQGVCIINKIWGLLNRDVEFIEKCDIEMTRVYRVGVNRTNEGKFSIREARNCWLIKLLVIKVYIKWVMLKLKWNKIIKQINSGKQKV